MGNDCVKTSSSNNGWSVEDLRATDASYGLRDTYHNFKSEKQRKQYYLNMNSEAAEK